jgi:glutamate/tyrosine decarboxylase-like PLP-dependent enzyme
MDRALANRVAELVAEYAERVAGAPVARDVEPAELRERLGGPLPEAGVAPRTVVEELAEAVAPGLVASTGPRYFGFVIGGALPAAAAADMLATAWDQCAGMYVLSPAAAVAEDVVAQWVLDLLGLPASAAVGFTTGAQTANFVALAAARHAVLARAGWDVERDGLTGAPRVNLVVGDEVHVTVLTALRMLGLGDATAIRVPADDQGRMIATELGTVLSDLSGPTIVCAQAGCVNTGAFDPLREIADLTRDAGAWLHVDGAFGLWAAASPGRRHLVDGREFADSWAVDFHKWLNVPYDSAAAIVADPEAQVAAMRFTASYIVRRDGAARDPADLVPESSRRARGFAVWAALRSFGRGGVADLVDRCCDLARRAAQGLSAEPGVEILNDVVLNQVLFALSGDPDGALTDRAISRVQSEGTCWIGGTRWRGRPAIRIAVSNWTTTAADVDRSVASIVAAIRAERAS